MNKIKQQLDDYADAVYRRAQGNALISEVMDARTAVQAAIKEKMDAKDAEIAALRQIISDTVTAIGSGAGVGVECSLGFLQHIPEEVRETTKALRLDAERYRWLRDPTSDVAQIVDKVTGEAPYDESFGTGGYKTYEYRAGADLDASVDTAMAQAVQA